MKSLFPYIKGYGVRSLLASLTIIAEVVLEVLIPYLMADIVNIGITNKDVPFILQRGGLMIAMAILSLAMGALSARLAVVGSAGFAKNLRTALFNKVQGFSFANVDHFSTASLITRLTNDVSNMQQTFMMIIRMCVRAPIMLVSATIMATKLNGTLATVFAFAIPVLAISLVVIGTRAFPLFKIMLAKYDDMNASVQEELIAMRVVKSFVREKHEDERFISDADAVARAQVKAERIIIFNMPIAQFILYVCTIAVLYIGSGLIIGGSMLTGDLMSFIAYISQILSSLMMLSMIFVMLVLSRASASRIAEVLNEKNDLTDTGADPALMPKDGSVSFKNVCFSYAKDETNLTLENINLDIKSGETIGVIGSTGSGKTTLVQLIPRLYDVYSGSISVGGHDVKKYTFKNLRDSVAMVLQSNVLFSGSIAENLRWGDLNATNEELRHAASCADADKFIQSFSEDYSTQLGQGGVNVSGGQKQRLAIARALLKKPKLIILDDSTSAVDTATDASIRKALREELRGMTTIIIAQRITSVMDADRIVVMDGGKIASVGTHDELMISSPIYREVYQSQQKGVA